MTNLFRAFEAEAEQNYLAVGENLMISLESSFMFKLQGLYCFISKLETTLAVLQ